VGWEDSDWGVSGPCRRLRAGARLAGRRGAESCDIPGAETGSSETWHGRRRISTLEPSSSLPPPPRKPPLSPLPQRWGQWWWVGARGVHVAGALIPAAAGAGIAGIWGRGGEGGSEDPPDRGVRVDDSCGASDLSRCFVLVSFSPLFRRFRVPLPGWIWIWRERSRVARSDGGGRRGNRREETRDGYI
jgi:hypothetical protein